MRRLSKQENEFSPKKKTIIQIYIYIYVSRIIIIINAYPSIKLSENKSS